VLAEYLRKQAIVQLVQDLKQPDRMNQDTVSLSELFHAHGVNMRYLGEVASQIDAAEFPGTIMQLERAILCKSLKHVFR
jgi:protein TIF31